MGDGGFRVVRCDFRHTIPVRDLQARRKWRLLLTGQVGLQGRALVRCRFVGLGKPLVLALCAFAAM
jgi:hypothetical protein